MDTLAQAILAVLVAALPFELNLLPLASSLQWLFLFLAAAGLPVLIRERKSLIRDRLVLAALAFTATQWLAALLAPEFRNNAILAAVRVTMGLLLLCLTLCVADRRTLTRVWCLSAVAAAVYGLLDHYGAGIPKLFHTGQFFTGGVQRLSGSFDYPNTAAAYFSMSLPVVWTALERRWLRVAAALLILYVLVLTYSRGAIIAMLVMLICWAVASRSRSMFLVAGLGFTTVIAFAVFQPFLLQRFADQPVPQAFAAECEPEFNKLRLPPDGTYDLVLRIRNTGTSTWETNSSAPFTVSYRWYDPLAKALVYKSLDFVRIPTPVRPQESLTIRVPFRVPHEPGLRLMTWDVSQDDKNRFRDHGVFPGLVEVDIQSGADPWFGHGDLSRWLRRDTSRLLVSGVPFTRSELWESGLDMFRRHPAFGVGPDNFRLLYGRYFGNYQWNTKIRANSLYVELLSGSGLTGLIAFLVMMVTLRRTSLVPVIVVGIFLVHGLVDVFLMTTPIYFAFWILLGLAHRGDLPIGSSAVAPAARVPPAAAVTTVYNEVASRYDSEVDGVNTNAQLRDTFRKRVSALAGTGTSILDFGCGTGTDAAWYAARGHRVIAYDVSSGMVDVLRSRCANAIAQGRIIPLAGDFKILKEELVRSGPVAAIAANFAVLNHVRDLHPLFRELARDVRPGGVLLMMVLNPFYLYDMKSRWWWKGIPRSLWTGSIMMEGEVTTYRHYGQTIRRMAAPYFQCVEDTNSAKRDSLNSNFMIHVLRKTQ